METGERIKAFANVVYGTASALADAVEMKPSSLHLYLNGERQPGTPVLAKLWQLGCSIEWLMFGFGKMFARNDAGKTLQAEQDRLIEELKAGKIKKMPPLVQKQKAVEVVEMPKSEEKPKPEYFTDWDSLDEDEVIMLDVPKGKIIPPTKPMMKVAATPLIERIPDDPNAEQFD